MVTTSSFPFLYGELWLADFHRLRTICLEANFSVKQRGSCRYPNLILTKVGSSVRIPQTSSLVGRRAAPGPPLTLSEENIEVDPERRYLRWNSLDIPSQATQI